MPKDFCCESNIVNSYALNVQVFDSSLTKNNDFQITRPELSGMITLITSALATQKLFSSFKYHQFASHTRFMYPLCIGIGIAYQQRWLLQCPMLFFENQVLYTTTSLRIVSYSFSHMKLGNYQIHSGTASQENERTLKLWPLTVFEENNKCL